MMTFTSSADLLRLQQTHPAHPVITTLANGLFTNPLDNDPVTVALMEPYDNEHPLAELFDAEDVTLEGILEQGGMFLIALQTEYDYGLIIVAPDEDWLSGSLRRCIKENLYN